MAMKVLGAERSNGRSQGLSLGTGTRVPYLQGSEKTRVAGARAGRAVEERGCRRRQGAECAGPGRSWAGLGLLICVQWVATRGFG